MSNNWAVINRAIRFASAGMSLDEAKALRDSLGKEFEVVTLSEARSLKQDMLNPLSNKRRM
jgi:ribosomal protein L7/L12